MPTPRTLNHTENIYLLGQLAVMLLSSFFSVSCCIGADEPEPHGAFMVTLLPRDLPVDQVEIHLFATGPFGGGGQGAQHQSGSHDFFIPEGTAKTLKAIICCPGYDIATISVPSVAASTHGALVTMKRLSMIRLSMIRLSMIRLSGQIASYKPGAEKDPVVCSDYVADWGMKFLGYSEGMVPTFKVAVVPLLPDGSFSAEIPDFSHVPYKSYSGTAADLQLFVRSKKSWNILLDLTPKSDGTPGERLKIKASYDNPTLFSIRRSH